MSNGTSIDASKTALVLAGGGSLGAVQVGMLKALMAHGINVDLVVGTSVGAINAAYFAAEPSLEGAKHLDQLWRKIRRQDVFPVSLIESILSLVSRRDHLVSATALRHLLEQHLPYQRLEETRIPCHIVATDLLQGKEIRLSSGSAVEAVLASAAIPAVFPPVRIGEYYLVDGGIANNTPISAAVALGATRVVVLPTGFACALQQAPTSTVGMALQAIILYSVRQLVRDIEHFIDQVDLTVVPPMCPLNVAPHDFSQTGELIDRAVQATELWLDKDGLRRHGVPGALRPHKCETGH